MPNESGARATIAVVEDNEDNRLLMRMLLEERFHVQEFLDGPSALAGVLETQPDLVLLDLALPGMDGLEVMRKLRALSNRPLDIDAVTAHAMLGDRERLLETGFDHYASKPIVDEDSFLETLSSLIEGRRS